MPFPTTPFFAWPPGDVHQWSSSRSAPKGWQPPFFQRLPLFEGVAMPKRKAASFFQRIPAVFKNSIANLFSKGCHSFGAGHIHKPFFQRLQLFGFAFLSFFAKDVGFFACMVPFFQGLQLLACSSQVYQICHSCHKIRVHMDPLFFCPLVPLPVGGNWDHI